MLFSAIRLIRAFLRKLREDSVSAFASQAAFFIILSFFPFVMFLLTLLYYLPVSVEEIRELITAQFPSTVHQVLTPLVTELMQKVSGTLRFATVFVALWSASRGALALSRGLNSVYQQKETRNYFLLRISSVLYTLIFAFLLIAALILLVFGNQLYQFILLKLPFLGNLAFILISMRSLLTMAVLTVFFLIIYLAVPNRKSRLWHELPGAILAAAGWLGFSYLFSFYIDHMGNYSYLYGSVAALAICMLWLYACMYILFIGAEVNVILSHPEIREATHSLIEYHRAKKQ